MPELHSSKLRVFAVALAVCLVCSVLVSVASVSLRGLQEANRELDKQRNILAAADLLPDDARAETVRNIFENIETRLVDLRSGRFVAKNSDIAEQLGDYDAQRLVRNQDLSAPLAADTDIAGLGRREHYAQVYLVWEHGRIESVILPIRGYGLWSTLHGFIALRSDWNTVVGLGFYQHGETPGLGGEVDNPLWKQRFVAKQVYDLVQEDSVFSQVALGVGKSSKTRQQRHYVDGISGATITTRGVHNMIHYWLGEDGFGPFLSHLKSVDPDLI